MPLNQQHILTAITRSITIPVDVPALQVVHTVELNLLPPPASTSALSAPYVPQMVTVGVALPAELVIRHSRNWDTSAIAARVRGALEFFFEVQNNPDTWLVGGRKRAHFTGTVDGHGGGSVHRFPLILVPAKPGHLLLPNVDIKPAAAAGGGTAEDGAGLALETEYKANAHVVLVLPGVRATTVRIDSAYPGEA